MTHRMKATDKIQLLERVRMLDGLTEEERNALLNLIAGHKTYGLVWEDKPETIEQRLASEYPVLTEVRDRAIISDTANSPNHIIIEGDNLEALTTLAYTHEGKIDIIYIDPPYNTGNKDFVYNDSFVDSDDSYRHSKWLSFMQRRLTIAKKLLADNGVIFISIGDEELANLKLLTDEIFSPIALVPRIAKKGSNQGTYFRPTKDYIIVCAKEKSLLSGFKDVRTCDNSNKKYPFKEQDTNRKYRKGHSLFQASLDSRPNQRYFIEAPDGTLILPPGDLIPDTHMDGAHIVPTNKRDKVWRWSYQTYLASKSRIMFSKSKRSPLIDANGSNTEWNVYEKKYEDEEQDIDPSTLPNDVIDKFINALGTTTLNDLGIEFSFSKPVELIRYLIEITSKDSDITILDFFAGSGTTLHATMQLNAKDKGKRKCILCTNNENGICENITYERNKRIINGYTKPNGEHVSGLLNNNLRYYHTDFVSRERTQKNRRELMEKSTDLLCIKEDLYTELTKFGHIGLNPKGARYFANDIKQMLIIYRPEFIPYFVEVIKKMDITEPIKVYVYAPDRYAYDDEFAIVAEKVSLCALPQNIIDSITRIMPDKTNDNTTTGTTHTI